MVIHVPNVPNKQYKKLTEMNESVFLVKLFSVIYYLKSKINISSLKKKKKLIKFLIKIPMKQTKKIDRKCT